MTHDDSPQLHSPDTQPHLYQPVPRRNFESHSHRDAEPRTASSAQPHSPSSSNIHSSRSSDFLAQLNARLLRTSLARSDAPESPVEGGSVRLPQNKSFLNMNSTLYGIYDDVGVNTNGIQSVTETPWGTGAETPGHAAMGWHGVSEGADAGISMKAARRGSGKSKVEAERRRDSQPRQSRRGVARYAVQFARLAALFTFGILYGLIVSYLHDTRQLAAVHVTGVNRESRVYLMMWGCAGVALGSLLPYVDLIWNQQTTSTTTTTSAEKSHEDKDADPPLSEQINDVVRSVAAFVGVAFAIRRLPWQSTLQLTLTLALVNPALWYILDRSKPGLTLSLLITSLLTSLLFLSNPTALPSPHTPGPANATHTAAPRPTADLFAGVISYENLAVVTWVGSVLFCSCVCFGSIGRRLAVLEGGWRRRA